MSLKKNSPSYQKGFTLVELAISMIIIGLLIVSIISGQSLIRAAKIRSVISEFADFQAAINLFEQTYGGKPGDVVNITELLPTIAAPWFNGNGDGSVEWAEAMNCTTNLGAAQSCSEGAQAWRHLGMSGMIPGFYAGTVVADFANIGGNVPASKMTPAGYGYDFDAAIGKNYLLFGMAAAGALNGNAIVSPADARDIDSKIDDGVPDNGFVRATAATAAANCVAGGAYKLDEGDTVRCALQVIVDTLP